MSKLEELEEELYAKGGEKGIEERIKRRTIFPGTLRKPKTFWQEKLTQPVIEKKLRRRFFHIFLAVVLLLLITGGAFFIFFYLGTKGNEAKISIQGTDRITGGDTVNIPIVVKNKSSVSLQGVELAILLPEGAIVSEEGREFPAPPRISKKLEDLRGGEERVIQITARMFGMEGEGKKVEAVLLYRPENLRVRFSVRESKVFTVGQVPFSISWELPETLRRGQEIEAKIRYASQSNHAFEGLSLLVEYPDGFTFKSADPKPEVGEAVWKLGAFGPGEEREIIIRGVVIGQEGSVKLFKAGVGIFNTLTKEWKAYVESRGEAKIAVTPLAVDAFLHGSKIGTIVPGDELDFSVRYKNNSDFTLKNISIRAFLSGESLLDFTSLAIGNGGVFDSANGAIVWGPGGTEILREAPAGKSGELSFRIKTRSRPVVRGTADKNLLVRLHSTIEAVGIPKEFSGTDLKSDETLDFKVKSKIIFAGRSLYKSSPIINSGPLPPRVGEKTTYTAVWEIRNFTNDLDGVEVRASLPPNVSWENVISPKDARIIFNSASGEVRWNIGTIKAGTGILTPALLGAFQISITPAVPDAGNELLLIKDSRLTAKDTFIGEDVEIGVESLSTELREDSLTSVNDWRVVK